MTTDHPPTEKMSDKFSPIRKGLLEFLILTIISTEHMYAKEILERLEFCKFPAREGTLYPLLNKMKREKLIRSNMAESDLGPPIKVYELTPNGKKRLEEFNSYWKSLNSTVHKLRRHPSHDR